MGEDCKSSGYAYGGSNPPRPSLKNMLATKAYTWKRIRASLTQLVEYHPSKVAVDGSSPLARSILAVHP